jgi:hypothetical protein
MSGKFLPRGFSAGPISGAQVADSPGGRPHFAALLPGALHHLGENPGIFAGVFEKAGEAIPCGGLGGGIDEAGLEGKIGQKGGFYALGSDKRGKIVPREGSGFIGGEDLTSTE